MALKNAFGNIALDASIKELLKELIGIFKAVSKPAWFDPSLNRIRETAIIESGTVTTVTTVTGVTNLGGYAAQLPTLYTSRTAWALGCRARIT